MIARRAERVQRTVDSSKAVTSESKRVGHHTETVFSDVERELARVGPFGSGVGNDHLGERSTVHDGTEAVLLLVKVLERVENDTLAVL